MENIQNFFSRVSAHIEDESNYYKGEFDRYPTVCNLDLDTLIVYKNKVGNKLLTLDKGNHDIYANLILECIDICNIQNRIKTRFDNNDISVDFDYQGYENDDKEIDENDTTEESDFTINMQVRLYKNINDIEVDITLVWEYCTVFISLIWEVFQSFSIDLRDKIKNKEGLRGDYSQMFIDDTYKHIWELMQEQKKVTETNNIVLYRQVLAIRTMLKGLGVNYNDLNNTNLTKFIQFLLNKEVGKSMRNSYIYEVVRTKKIKTEKRYDDDCDFVAEEFEKIKLSNLAEDIRKSKEKR